MSTTQRLPARSAGLAPAAGGVRRLISVLDLALEVRRERRMLQSMDERALKDIGLSSSEAWAESCRWFWDLPCERR
ncbi:MAG: DUF1127 domain-containing protein [Bradyrhizobiaceae bacterium]|nr:DUF1127 domain-containing protein [Bradyrhizobiaceae bacterium]